MAKACESTHAHQSSLAREKLSQIENLHLALIGVPIESSAMEAAHCRRAFLSDDAGLQTKPACKPMHLSWQSQCGRMPAWNE